MRDRKVRESKNINFTLFKEKIDSEIDRMESVKQKGMEQFSDARASEVFELAYEAKSKLISVGLLKAKEIVENLTNDSTNLAPLKECQLEIIKEKDSTNSRHFDYMMSSMPSCDKYLGLAYDHMRAEGVDRAIKFLDDCIEEN